MEPQAYHRPVLLEAVVEILSPAPGKVLVDATLGGGGHSRALLAGGASVVGIDQDPDAIAHNQPMASDRFQLIRGNFGDLPELLGSTPYRQVDGILFDLGVSSHQLDQPHRGFSYQLEGPLDMRMAQAGPSALDLVNRASLEDLARILYAYGEEPASRRIARAILQAREHRPIQTTTELAELIRKATGHRRGGHPARRSFQALRIAVNGEMEALSRALAASEELLRPGGRLAVISFHSLEDRQVKRFLAGRRSLVAPGKQPVVPEQREQQDNPRARSAKLRWAVRQETET
jgi:16S rRNA (cytosine1402-N4)-methyltransferase